MRGQAAETEKKVNSFNHEQRRERSGWWEHQQWGDAISGNHRGLDGQSDTTSAERKDQAASITSNKSSSGSDQLDRLGHDCYFQIYGMVGKASVGKNKEMHNLCIAIW